MVLCIATICVLSCSKEEHICVTGEDCSIISLELSIGDTKTGAIITADTLKIYIDYNDDPLNATATYILSEGASATPDIATIKDWSSPFDITVTSHDNKNKTIYHYTPVYTSTHSWLDKNVYLTSQEEVDDFASHKYTRVKSLIINDTEETPITDLSGLNSLRTVDLNLTIKGYHGNELSMDNLTRISSFDIAVPTIEKIGFPKLEEINNLSIGEIIEEQNSPYIDSLYYINFQSLRLVKGNFTLEFVNFNPEFNISGFENLEKVDGELAFNFNTQNLKCFSKLNHVNNMTLKGTIKSFEGFEQIKKIRQLKLYYLMGCESMLPFKPEEISVLHIEGAQHLTSLDFCSDLKTLKKLYLHGIYQLNSLDGLQQLKNIDTDLYIAYGQKLVNLDPFSNLEKVGERIVLGYNSKLEDFSGLKRCLETFNGEWTVMGNKQNPTIEDILNN